jgi:hypothetical protein
VPDRFRLPNSSQQAATQSLSWRSVALRVAGRDLACLPYCDTRGVQARHLVFVPARLKPRGFPCPVNPEGYLAPTREAFSLAEQAKNRFAADAKKPAEAGCSESGHNFPVPHLIYLSSREIAATTGVRSQWDLSHATSDSSIFSSRRASVKDYLTRGLGLKPLASLTPCISKGS